MTLPEFSEVFALLAVQLRASDVDEATIRGYYEALKDLELEFVAFAAQKMAKQGGATDADRPHWFPKTSEWRHAAGTVEGERAAELKAILRKLPRPLCAVCDDTGWRSDNERGEDRWKHCECRTMRRLEVLGRRPMPQLTDGPVPELVPIDLAAIAARVKGMR